MVTREPIHQNIHQNNRYAPLCTKEPIHQKLCTKTTYASKYSPKAKIHQNTPNLDS